VRAVGIHLVQGTRADDAPARSAVAEISAQNVLSGLRFCRTADDVRDAVSQAPGPALVLVDAPLAVPPVRGRRDVEQVLAWLDIPAFPVTPARMDTAYGGARGVGLARQLEEQGHVTAEAIPDQVLRQLLWEREHPPGSPARGLATYRAEWLGIRAPSFRPRGGRARNEGLTPAREILTGHVDLSAWPAPERPGDLADLDEAAAIDAVACALVARRCLQEDAGWALIGSPAAGRVVLAAGPDLIDRARVNIDRLREEGSIGIPREVAAGEVGPPQSW
jgi:predicted nuclease with RNAse H fold